MNGILAAYSSVLRACCGGAVARPGFGPAESLDADVAAKMELVAVGGHCAFVGLAGFGVVEPAAVGGVGSAR